jgi:hypothetical protein
MSGHELKKVLKGTLTKAKWISFGVLVFWLACLSSPSAVLPKLPDGSGKASLTFNTPALSMPKS